MSWAFLISLPLLFAPGVLGLIGFRLIIPHVKSRHSSDYIYFFPSTILTLLINLELISFFASSHYTFTDTGLADLLKVADEPYFKILPYTQGLLNCLHDFIVGLPASICSLPALNIPEFNLISFVFEIQIRAFLIGFLAAIFLNRLFFIDDYYEAFPYFSEDYKNSKFHKILGLIGGKILRYDLRPEIAVEKRYPDQNTLLSKFLRNVKSILSNDWINSFSYNSRIEILMVDIKTTEDHLYSGTFTNLIGGKDKDFEAISLYNVICYYPDKPASKQSSSENTAADSHKKQNDFKVSTRKWSHIKNNGEMYIREPNILTINFWYIRKGAKLSTKIYVDNDYLLEKMKWTLALINTYPRIIDSYIIEFFYYEDNELQTFLKLVDGWSRSHNFKQKSKIQITTKRLIRVGSQLNLEIGEKNKPC